MTEFKGVNLSGLMDSIAAKSASISKECEGDYYEDDLLHCGKCHTKKQTRQINPFTHEPKVLSCVCQCEFQRIEAERKRFEQEAELRQIKRMKAECVQDKNILNWNFANDDGSNPKMKNARTYVEKWQQMYDENIGFLLYGDVGTGKTFFAACIANALLDQGIPVLVTNFSRLVNQLSGFKEDKNEFLNSLNRYKLLIIDDLGVERQSEFVMEQVYNIIDSRYKNGQPMIITTNIPIKEIQDPQDMNYKRIYDRILENCVPVEITGVSRRKQAKADKIKRARELFK